MKTANFQIADPTLAAAVLEFIDKPALMVGFDFRIAAANNAFRKLVSPDEPVGGRRCFEVSHGRDTPCEECEHSCPLAEVRRRQGPVRAVHEHWTAAGRREFEIESRGVFSDDSRDQVGVLMLLRPRSTVTSVRLPAALVGSMPETVALRDRLARVAPTDLPVLLVGEFGTLKGSVALAIHTLSGRSQRPFDQIACQGLIEGNAVCEIFGCWAPGPSGHPERRAGRLEGCRGGTLYCSEAELLPAGARRRLQRLLRTGTYRLRGSLQRMKPDVRLILSTSRPSARGPVEGRFADEDLLQGALFPLCLPPLRRRLADLEEIADRVAEEVPALVLDRVTEESWSVLRRFEFPGNVRQLRSVLEQAFLLAGGERILPRHLPDVLASVRSRPIPFDRFEGVVSLEELRSRYATWAAEVFGGSRSALASRLGISDRTLYRHLRRASRSSD